MTTVKEFKDLGVEFVEGDVYNGNEVFVQIIPEGLSFSGELETSGGIYNDKELNMLIPSLFRWRNNTGINPTFKGLIEYEVVGGYTYQGNCQSVLFNTKACGGDGFQVVKWRPLLDQSIGSLSEVKPVFTQAMADAGELPPVGSLFLNESIEVECIAIHNGRAITVSDSVYYSLPVEKCHPIKILTPKQKAVSEALKLFIDGEHVENAVSKIYDLWNK